MALFSSYPGQGELPVVWQELYSELIDDLFVIQKQESHVIRQIELSMKRVTSALNVLRDLIKEYTFSNKSEEIFFYKEVRPSFHSHLIFLRQLFQIEISRPPGTAREQQSYLEGNIQKLHEFFLDNRFIYQYLRSGLDHLDEKFFFRPTRESVIGMRMESIDEEPDFPVSFDYLVARVKANDKLFNHLNEALDDLQDRGPDRSYKPTLKWTHSKAALIELAYALQATGVFNDGKTDLKDVIEGLQNAFQIELGHFARTMQEILCRKSGYTTFHDALKAEYLKYINRIESRHIK